MNDVRGFSLVEAIIVVALLATALLAFAHLAGLAVASNTAARHFTHASLIAAEKVEALRSAPVAPAAGADYIDRWGAPTERAGATYERRWTAERLPGSAIGTVLIQVRVARVGGGPASGARVIAAARLP